MIPADHDPDFMLSLARGMETLRAFEGHAALTIAQAGHLTGLPRSSVRRCLHTLEKLGYLDEEDGRYRMAPALLPLARAYVTCVPVAVAAQPVIDSVRDRLGESCSLAVLDLRNRPCEVVYVARAEAARSIAMPLRVGSTLPAYCSSLGRVLLGGVDADMLDACLTKSPLLKLTSRTVVDAEQIRRAVAEAADQGFALVDEELELGLRSIAVPVRDHRGRMVAALNVGAPASRQSVDGMMETVLPELRAAALHLGRSA